MYLERTADKTLVEAAEESSAVVLTGPRQSGKTTTLRHVFGASHGYVSLDEPDTRFRAQGDPRLFLMENPPPVIYDEIQHAPELFSYVKAWIDRHRSRKGSFLLIGSQIFALMHGVSESLAGRARPLTLLSFSLAERNRDPGRKPFWAREEKPLGAPVPGPEKVWKEILAGGFPDVATGAIGAPERFYSAYIQTYLERDVRALRHVGDLRDFQRFLFASAARAGGLVNMSELARELGLSQGTVRAWFSVLEAGGQICLLKPYFRNLGKRSVKRPKLYFLDTGLLAALVHLRDVDHARRGPMAGALFENAVFAEIYRAFVHRGEIPAVYFWRSASGHEVDFIVEVDGRAFGFEAKTTATPRRDDVSSLVLFGELLGHLWGGGALVCLTGEPMRLTEDIWAMHLWHLC